MTGVIGAEVKVVFTAGNVSQMLSRVVALASCTSEQELVDDLVEVAMLVCGADHCTATLLGSDGLPSFWAQQASGDTPAGTSTSSLAGVLGLDVADVPVGNRDSSALLAPLLVDDRPTPGLDRPPLLVPIELGGHVLGWLQLERTAPGAAFDADELDQAVTIAAHTAITVHRLRQGHATQHVLNELSTSDRVGHPAKSSPEDLMVLEQASAVSSLRPGNGADLLVSHLVRRLTAKARTIVGTQAMILSRIQDGRQTFMVTDVEPGSLSPAEGYEIAVADSYCGLLLAGELPAVVPDVWRHPLTAAHPLTAPLGLGSYCGTPVVLPDGTIYGTLAGFDTGPTAALSTARLQALRTMAQLIGLQLAKEHQQLAQQGAQRASFAVFIDGDVRSTVLQPIVNLTNGQVSGFEALSRFTQPTSRRSPRPDEVFARAARLGMTRDLEHASATSALQLLDQMPASTYLSINLSPGTLIHPATWDLFTTYDLSRVVLELTEHEQVEDYDAVAAVVDALRARGARLAIDDLGAGFAGLQHLARLRPEVVKLDMSFVRNVDVDPTRAAVARAVSGFAAEVGAVLVAEGIETFAELQRLQHLGASHGQGYLLGRPGTVQDVLAVHAHGANAVA